MLVGAVLVGGESRRMGRPKALVPVDGVALAARVAAVLAEGGADRVVLVGGDPDWAHRLGLEPVADRWPGLGPLGGLASALAAAGPDDLVVVAACDQVALDAGLVAALVDAVRSAPPAVAASAPVTDDGRRHPFPSAWRAAVAPAVAALVDGGSRRADAAFDPLGVVDVAVEAAALVDVDTPADLARWQLRDRIVPE